MSKDKKLIPELRFPEFVNEGEWGKDNVDNIFDLQDGYPFSSFDFTKDKKDSNQVIRITDINNQNKSGEKVYVSKIKSQELDIQKYEVQKGDLLLSLTGAAGFNFFIWKDDKSYINQRTMKLSPRNIDNESLKFLLEPLIHSKINALGTGQNNNLSKDALKEIEFPFPKPKEQQKIAYCLSSLDEVITAHSQKLDALKEHKKGLMQNLFPQVGEKVPKYRFKEFEKDGEWVEKQLGEVSKFVRGPFGGALKKEIFVSSGFAVYEQSHAIYSNLKEFRYFINEEKFQELKRFAVNAGNLIMSCSGTMGKFAIIPQNFTKGVINQALLKLEIKKEFSVDFIKLILELPKNQEQILSQAGGGAIKNVASVSILQEIKIEIPKLKEQQKIASCLSTLEASIAAQAEKIEQLKLHKKGLMQGLFPKIND